MHQVYFYAEEKNLERYEMVKFYCPLKKKRYKKEQIEKMCKDCPKCGSCNTGLAVTKGECGGGEDIPFPSYSLLQSIGEESNEI